MAGKGTGLWRSATRTSGPSARAESASEFLARHILLSRLAVNPQGEERFFLRIAFKILLEADLLSIRMLSRSGLVNSTTAEAKLDVAMNSDLRFARPPRRALRIPRPRLSIHGAETSTFEPPISLC